MATEAEQQAEKAYFKAAAPKTEKAGAK